MTIPLSDAQKRLWFTSQLEGSSAYNIPVVLRLTGRLDRAALVQATADVVARHDVLRTVYPLLDDEPHQLILAASQLPALTVLEDCDPAGAEQLVAAHTRYAFDLGSEPPLRCWLVRTGAEEHLFVLVLHHIATDGWSIGPLLADLGTAYRARLSGEPARWPELAADYTDYALWHRELLGDAGDDDSLTARQTEYWRAALAGLPEEIALPRDRQRPAEPSHRGGLVVRHLDPQLHAALLALARRNDVTLFMLLQAAFAILLSRLGAGDDIPLGTPVAGRTDEALDNLIGFFVNTLVLRTDLTDNPTFTQLLHRTRETDLHAFAHQDLPFERLVEALNPPRSTTRHPLFQTMIVLQNHGREDMRLHDLQVAVEQFPTRRAKCDLMLAAGELHDDDDGSPAGISGALEYAVDLFDHATVEEFARRLERVLRAVVDRPDAPIADLDVLSAAERRLILADWNDTSVAVPADTLASLCSRQAGLTPTAIALIADGPAGRVQLSYAQFDSAVERLARALCRGGVGPGRTVAVSMPRSAELVVALHAVLRAGAAYLPLDPDYPAARVEYMLADAAPAVVLTPRLYARLLAGDELDQPALPVARPGDPAYVIYTSGSTGRPKGVVIRHEAIVNRLLWMQSEYGLEPGERVLQKTPSSFDVSVWEFFWPLAVGATLVVARPGGHQEPWYLLELIERERVSTVHFVPSMLDAFLADPAAAGASTLRRVLCSGEALTTASAERFSQTLDAELHNLYGPTEAAVDVTSHRFTPAAATITVPIGRPVWNTRVYVLDERLQPVPPGVDGELYLAGIQLAEGYLNQAGLTSERFVANPFGPPGSRMYRTGDVVRWCGEGVLRYHGRSDDQVKIRGLRIELGEIEQLVNTHPAVLRSAVVAQEHQPGDGRLIAYVVADGPVEPDAIRQHVAAALPAFMVPAQVILLDEVPLTPSGKLDRGALPAPLAPAVRCRPPASEAERRMCALFAEVLGVPAVGPDDGFFDLGGHSLLAIRLVSLLRGELGVELDIRTLFESGTPAGLVQRLCQDERGDPLAVLLPLRTSGTGAPLFCVHPAAGIGWVYAGLLQHLPDRPVYALQSRGLSEPGHQAGDMSRMVKDYLAELRLVAPTGPYHLLGWSVGANIAHALACQLQSEGETVALLALLDGYPATAADPRPERGDPQLLEALLASLGIPAPGGSVGTPAEFEQALGARDSLVAALDPAALRAMPDVFADNIAIRLEHRPATFTGNAVFFRAARELRDQDPVRAWQPYVAGAIAVHDIDCSHGDLASPAALRGVAEVLAAADPPSLSRPESPTLEVSR